MAEDQQATIIGADTQIKGEMTFDKSCRLLGRFEGTIHAKGQLHIADGATCNAEVEAANILVDGSVEGNVTAKEKIQLNAKANVNGDVTASKLEVAEGASFRGHVSVGPNGSAGAGRSPSQASSSGSSSDSDSGSGSSSGSSSGSGSASSVGKATPHSAAKSGGGK